MIVCVVCVWLCVVVCVTGCVIVILYDCVWLCVCGCVVVYGVCGCVCDWVCVDLTALLCLMPPLAHPASPAWPAGECPVSAMAEWPPAGLCTQAAPVRTLQP